MIEPASSQSLLGTFGIDLKHFLAQLVNFSVVLVVMWRWVYRPLVKMMDARAKEIAGGIENAKEAKQHLVDAAADRDRLMRKSKAERRQLLEEVKEHAEILRQEELAHVASDAEKLLEDARGRIAAEREASFHALKNDFAMLVAEATKKVAGSMDEKSQRMLITEAMKELQQS